ncbi:MAG TPA: pyrimidine 5'-nucleotidase [Rhizomicrobium sp.]|nr:pyrimidine 5'-nucleotidase [Rhizomicrobium sp.]
MFDRMRAFASEPSASAPDFRHVEAWIFDLDNTLYRPDTGVFAEVESRMTWFIADLLTETAEVAGKIRKDYYRQYGSTLNGLMLRHRVDPEAFLDFVHDIDLSPLEPDQALNAAIERLPGRRFVFTNGCRRYAQRVLDRIGLDRAIDGLWDIRSSDFAPKPEPAAYRTAIASERIDPKRAAMFEDVARNLEPARALGMTTVWIDPGPHDSLKEPEGHVSEAGHVDFVCGDLAQFLGAIRI